MVVVKDLIKSKTMIYAMVFIIAVSYIGGLNNRNLSINVKNNANIAYEIN